MHEMAKFRKLMQLLKKLYLALPKFGKKVKTS